MDERHCGSISVGQRQSQRRSMSSGTCRSALRRSATFVANQCSIAESSRTRASLTAGFVSNWSTIMRSLLWYRSAADSSLRLTASPKPLARATERSRPGRSLYRKSIGPSKAEPPNHRPSADDRKTIKQSDGCCDVFDIFGQWLICNTPSNSISRL
jgi:hypothetical protein